MNAFLTVVWEVHGGLWGLPGGLGGCLGSHWVMLGRFERLERSSGGTQGILQVPRAAFLDPHGIRGAHVGGARGVLGSVLSLMTSANGNSKIVKI